MPHRSGVHHVVKKDLYLQADAVHWHTNKTARRKMVGPPQFLKFCSGQSAQGTQLVNLKFAILVCHEPLELAYWFTYQNVQPSGATEVLV